MEIRISKVVSGVIVYLFEDAERYILLDERNVLSVNGLIVFQDSDRESVGQWKVIQNETRFLASNELFDLLREWDMTTGRLLRRVLMPYISFMILQVPFVIGRSDNKLYLWDINKGIETFLRKVPRGRLNIVNSDKRVGMLMHVKTVLIWPDCADVGQCVEIRHTRKLDKICFCGDMVFLADWSGTITMWHIYTGVKIRDLQVHTTPIKALEHFQEHLVSMDREGTCILWNKNTGEAVRQILDHGVAFYGSSKYLVIGGASSIRIWDRTNGELVATHPWRKPSTNFRLTDDGRLTYTVNNKTFFCNCWLKRHSVFAFWRMLRMDGDLVVVRSILRTHENASP